MLENKLKVNINNQINFESIIINEDNKDVIDFFSEITTNNGFKVLGDENLNIFFDDKTKINSFKAKYLIDSIIKETRNYFWPRKNDIIGRCKIIELSGEGFTSNVYKATHEFLGIEVAIKILSNDLKHNNPNIETMFLEEAINTAKLRHPNLVGIFDANKGNKYTYMIMEFVDGIDLDKFLEKNGVLQYKDAIPIMIKICDALIYALKNGIIHRDIKPSNIMVSKKLEVKLLDLGLSKRINFKSEAEQYIVGTPLYMSPEQFIDSNSVDHRADLYSLGATFYHLLTGQPPFKTKTYREMITAKFSSYAFDLKINSNNYPDEIKIIITKLMQRDRELRYQSYEILRKDLTSLIN